MHMAMVIFHESPASRHGIDRARVSSRTTQVSLKDVHLTVPVHLGDLK